MKLQEMTRTVSGKTVSYRSGIAGKHRPSGCEAHIAGPKGIVEKVLGESNFVLEVDSDASREAMEKRALAIMEPYNDVMAKAAADASFPKFAGSKKTLSPRPAAQTLTLSIRPLGPHKTFWYFDTLIPIPLPGALTLQVFFPPCFAGGAMSLPVAGNPNILIRFNSPVAPIAAASLAPGLSTDAATFSLAPWTNVLPFFQFVHAAPVVTHVICWGMSVLPF